MDAFRQVRTYRRAWRLGLTGLLCLGRHTLSNVVCTGGRQFADWSADYRLFSQDRWQMSRLFAQVLEQVLEQLAAKDPLVLALDDTLLRKTGTHAKGVGYRRDPLSPAFHCNLIRAQRFIQVAAPLHHGQGPGPARCIPVAYDHAPSVVHPKASAPPEQWQLYRKQRRLDNLSTRALRVLQELRGQVDALPQGAERRIIVAVDGSYTNRTVIRGLPERTVLIGRVRKDIQLLAQPEASAQAPAGSPRRYGALLPTPLELRQDESIPWQLVPAFAAGELHPFRVKSLGPVLWRKAGWQRPLQVLVIAPLGYRLRQASELLYRQPAYLICTDPQLPCQSLLQFYLWRWGIEVNHRDEKQLLGVGQAQVTNDLSVDRLPAFAVFNYALLLLAAVDAYGTDTVEGALPPPKWRSGGRPQRLSSQQILQQLRKEVWAHGLGDCDNSDHFVSALIADTKSQQFCSSLPSAVLYGSVA
jgi:hypothetical protein